MRVSEKRREQAREYARRDLDKHVITRERFGVWRCAEPGSWINGFYVTWSPGAVIVHGDLGELILVPYKPNAFKWALGVCRPDYVDYPLEKIARNMKAEEYVPEIADEIVQDYLTNPDYGLTDDQKNGLELGWEAADRHDERALYDALTDAAIDHDYEDNVRAFTMRTLVVYQALCWFFTHVNAEDERFKEELSTTQ